MFLLHVLNIRKLRVVGSWAPMYITVGVASSKVYDVVLRRREVLLTRSRLRSQGTVWVVDPESED